MISKKIDEKNVYPILGIHDQIIEYPLQKNSYTGQKIVTLDKGHVRASVDYKNLLNHISNHI